MKTRTVQAILILTGLAAMTYLGLTLGRVSQASFPPTPMRVTTTPTVLPSPTATPAPPQAILDDVRVRQAIAHCTNRTELIRAAYPWLEDTRPFEMDSFLPSNHPYYAGDDPEFQHYLYNPEKGRALLESAGWTLFDGAKVRVNAEGEELRLSIRTLRSRTNWTRVLIDQWLNCGIDLEENHYGYAMHSRTPIEAGNFEVGIFPQLITTDLEFTHDRYACESIPTIDKYDYGLDNYAGWCNPRADQTLRQAKDVIESTIIEATFRTLQIEYSRDVPGLPLFRSMLTSATHGELRNFIPLPNYPYAWNAAEWEIPGKNEIVIGESFESPDDVQSLNDLWSVYGISALIEGLDYVERDYIYYPITMDQFPTLENGGAEYHVYPAKAGDMVYNKHGKLVELDLGVRVFDIHGNDTLYVGEPILMERLIVTYEFLESLTWSDGVPVTREDYQLAFRIMCSEEVTPWYYLPDACEYITHVDFTSDRSYTVTYAAGYHNQTYFLPPIERQPAHRITEDGRRLSDVPDADWKWLEVVNKNPIGIGPYVLHSWEKEQMVFKANPHYFGGTPLTPTIIFKSIAFDEDQKRYLLNGQIDVMAYFWHGFIDRALLQAEADGKVRLYFTPGFTYEQLDFRLTVK